MSLYVSRSCPHCGVVIESYTRDYREIGQPFMECEHCSGFIVFKHINEWKLTPWYGKLWFLLIVLWTTFMYSFGLTVVFVLICQWQEIEAFDPPAIFIGIALEVSLVIFIFYNIIQRIRESAERMADPDYRQKLSDLGLM